MGTHYKGTNKEISSLNTFIKLVRSSDSIISKTNFLLSKRKLTESQFNILDSLFHLGPLSQKDLGKKLLKSGGNITHVVDNLEKVGLVRRERGKDDRRIFQVYLTNDGKKLYKETFPDYLKTIVEAVSILSESEQNTLQKLCKKIGLKEVPSIKN